MAVTASLVQQLHRINRQKTDLNGQLKRGPRTVAVSEGKLKEKQAAAEELREKKKRAHVDADDKQLQMKSREEKIHELEGKLNAAKENREYQALKDQIAADTQANVVLSDEILELLEAIDALEGDIAAAENEVKEAEKELEETLKRVADRKLVLESDLERVEAELAETEKGLEGDFKREYERLVKAKGEEAMAELEGSCCSSCYQNLTPQLLDRLAMMLPVICPACGCLIYKHSSS